MAPEKPFRPSIEKGQPEKKQKLGVQRIDYSEGVQRLRKKANIRYEKGGEKRFVKYVKRQKVGLDNMAGLAREARLLQKAATTGIVPEVVDFKVYPNDEKARLVLKEIPGKSFDRMDSVEKTEFLKIHSQEVIQQTAAALQKVRDAGVHVVDINEGTFLFDETNDGLQTRLLDLEIGFDEHDSQQEHDRALEFLKRADPACQLNPDLPADNDVLTKMEMHRWAKTMKSILFPRRATTVSVPEARRPALERYLQVFLPSLEARHRAEAQRVFKSLQPGRNDRELALGEEQYVEGYVKSASKWAVVDAASLFALPDLLKANNVQLDERTVSFLSRCFSPYIEDRPSSFDELLSEQKKAA